MNGIPSDMAAKGVTAAVTDRGTTVRPIVHPASTIVLAIAIPFAALGLQWLLWDYFRPYVWFLFLPATFVSAWIGGLVGGLAATVISASMVWYFFIPPALSFAFKDPSASYAVAVFVLMGGLFSWFHERLRRSMRHADEALATAAAASERITHLYEETLQLDALKSQFFANLSHELRTPLTLILAPLEQRLRRAPGPDFPEAERRETEVMLRNARVLYRHVTDLLDAARLDADRVGMTWSRLDLARLIRAMASHFEALAAERRIAYTVSAPERLQIEADGEKLQRILLNLLSNAFKFTPDGGAITLRLGQTGTAALIEVQDNGPGVPPALRKAVFERFRQGQDEGGARRNHVGTGLGLSIVKEFIELHDGTVDLTEAPGGGALFSVQLPLAAPSGTVFSAPVALDEVLDRQAVEELEVHPRPEAPILLPADDEALVLVVESNIDLNEFITTLLRPHYRVCNAFNGREGMDMALALRPDLIITDLMMPVMSGDELVTELRSRPVTSELPIVVLSARNDDDMRLRLLRQGVQDYLTKPFSTEELLARVGSLVASRRRTEAELAASAARLRRLAEVVEQIAAVRDLPSLMAIVRRAVRELTGADGVTLVLRDGGHCHYVDEDAIGPLWKGQRFPLESCISGWSMLHAEAVAIEDIYVDPRIPYAAYRPTFVKSLSMVPIGRDQPQGAIGCYWAVRHRATADELELQQALADAMSVGMANLDLYRDLTRARQLAEQAAAAARASAAVLKEAQHLAGLGNWSWDLQTDSHFWSEEIFRMYGRDPSLPPATYPEVQRYFTPDSWDRLAAAVEIARTQGTPYECDAEIVRADGTRRWVMARGDTTLDADGIVIELHGTVQDITERKQVAEELRELNSSLEQRVELRTAELTAANKELDTFAYAVSHDLRAPLRAMSGFSQALLEDYGDRLDGDAKSYLDQINMASRKMSLLIDGVLSLSRSARGDLQHETIDLSAMAAGIANDLARTEPERDVATAIEPGLNIVGDPRMVEAVMRNLLGNAWKYTGKTAHPAIRVYKYAIDGRQGICVADNGAGFDMAHSDQLFQPFRRLHRQDEFPGIGIGLATVQRIVRRHGGAIRAQAAPGEGATFCFTLDGECKTP